VGVTRALVIDAFALLVRVTTLTAVTGVERTKKARRLRPGRGDALDVQGPTTAHNPRYVK
jgi:hypothetical protein